MDISLDTEVMKKIEKDLAYNLVYLEQINTFLALFREELAYEFKGEGAMAMSESVDMLKELLDEKNRILNLEFCSSLRTIRENFEEIDQEIAKKIADAK